jgi:hypothetical protein
MYSDKDSRTLSSWLKVNHVELRPERRARIKAHSNYLLCMAVVQQVQVQELPEPRLVVQRLLPQRPLLQLKELEREKRLMTQQLWRPKPPKKKRKSELSN